MAVSFTSACGRSGEVLATYEGGQITRGEMRLMFEMIFGADAEQQATIDQQNQLLSNFAMMKLAAAEAEGDENLAQSDAVKRRLVISERQAKLMAYNLKLQRGADDHEIEFYDMQFLWLSAKRPGSDGSDPNERLAEAEDLVAQLNKIKDDQRAVEDFIRERSEHARYRWIGGYLDPQCTECRMNQTAFLTRPLKETEAGTFILTRTPDALWIIRKTKAYNRSLDSLTSIFEDYHRKTMRILERYRAELPEEERSSLDRIRLDEARIEQLAQQQADHLRRNEGRGLLTSKLNALREEKNLEILPAAQPQTPPQPEDYTAETGLFKVGDDVFTIGDLDEVLGEYAEGVSLSEKIQITNSVIVATTLLKGESGFENIASSDEYEFVLDLQRSEALAQSYYEANMPEINIDDAQVRQQYEIGRQTRYKGKSFGEVRDNIRNMLEGQVRQQAVQEIQSKLSDKYKLKIEREKLEANVL